MRHLPWILWLAVTAALAAGLVARLRGPDPTPFLPGTTTPGHHQIERDCAACHTPMMGVRQDACLQCHAAELKAAKDSHPASKFSDPRHADLLGQLDATRCISCHREHSPSETHPMGVTLPADLCFHCHQETVRERESHKDYGFQTCANAGCHNYHDNSALYEDFLGKHLGEPPTRPEPAVPSRNLRDFLLASGRPAAGPLDAAAADAPEVHSGEPDLLRDWEETAHARAGIQCTACHQPDGADGSPGGWVDRPGHAACATCHGEETAGFLAGRHGMRLDRGLSPMTPALARIPMKTDAAHRELTCASCHGAHRFDTRTAAVDSCLQCHDDDHSRAYRGSVHFSLWREEQEGRAPAGSGVSCATCHLPREVHADDDTRRVLVQHNQNATLRPNEKMIRTVCLSCHGLGFSLDALADPALVRANFTGQPARHVESLDLVERRRMKTGNQDKKPQP